MQHEFINKIIPSDNPDKDNNPDKDEILKILDNFNKDKTKNLQQKKDKYVVDSIVSERVT